MGSIKNLTQVEAANKLKELADSATICLFTTRLNVVPLTTRPMGTMHVDTDGTLWFFSSRGSAKNADISLDNRVHLFYSNTSAAEFLNIYGEAEIIRDTEKAKALWSPVARTWFNEGAGDPELTIIKVTPVEAYYWDTAHNKMVTLVKIWTGALIGKTMDDGVEGKMDLQDTRDFR